MNLMLGIVNTGIALLCIIMSIPLLLGKIKMNHCYGFRIKQASVSDENWFKIHRYFAKQMIGWMVPLLLIGIITFFVDFGPTGKEKEILITVFSAAPMVLMPAVLFSYLYARRQ